MPGPDKGAGRGGTLHLALEVDGDGAHPAAGRIASVPPAEAQGTVGARPLDTKVLRREITDVIDVARALWDSWEDDAVIKDVATGRFLDWRKVHHVDFQGARFDVKGPLITPGRRTD